MMRRTFTILFLLFTAVVLNSQVLEPVTWSFKSEKISDNGYELVMTAEIDEHWHLYAMDIGEGGPIATSFTFEEAVGYTTVGQPFAVTKPEVKYDNSFDMNIGMHSNTAEFRQKVTVSQSLVTVKGYVTFMSCDDKQCLPPRDVDFAFELKGTSAAAAKPAGKQDEKVAGTAAAAAETTTEPLMHEAAETPEVTTVQQGTTVPIQPAQTTTEQPRKGFLKFFLLSCWRDLQECLLPASSR